MEKTKNIRKKWIVFLIFFSLLGVILHSMNSIFPAIRFGTLRFFWSFDKSMFFETSSLFFAAYNWFIFFVPIIVIIILLIYSIRNKDKFILFLSLLGIIIFISPFFNFFIIESYFKKKLTVEYCNQRPEDVGDKVWVLDKFWCFNNLAEQEKDFKYCNFLVKVNQIGAHERDQCLENYAYSLKDAESCSALEFGDSCYEMIAREKQDSFFCSKITSNDEKFLCLNSFSFNIDLCKKVSDPQKKSWCISNIAMKTKNPLLCEEIDYLNEKENCYSALVYQLLDPSLCKKVPVWANCEEWVKSQK